MKWFRKAADQVPFSDIVFPHISEFVQYFQKNPSQGHPHASYNLAVGHLTGVRTDVQPGEIHELIRLKGKPLYSRK